MTDRYDSSDLDAIRELRRSQGWKLVKQRITDELERQRIEMERPADWGVTNLSRGQVKAFRTVIEIPGILENEISKQVKS